MNKFVTSILMCMATLLTVRAEETTSARKPWRLTVGGVFMGQMRSHVGVRTDRVRAISGFGTAISKGLVTTRTKQEAYEAASGGAKGDSKRVFDDGAWYDPNDSGKDDADWSWNWRLHDPGSHTEGGNKGFIETTSYDEVHEVIENTLFPSGRGSDSSDEWQPGIRVEVARELYVSEGERPWGVDLAVAFSYFFERSLWKTDGLAARATVDGTREKGHFEWWNDSNNEAQYILDYYRSSALINNMWGVGTFDGPGPELFSDGWTCLDGNGVSELSEKWHDVHTLSYHGKGDYRVYAIEGLVRPWWEPWPWCRIFGSVGVAAMRREFKWRLRASGTDGTSFSESGHERDWTVLGLLGGGLSLQYDDFFIMGEALWMLGDNELDVEGTAVNGDIETGDYNLRVSIGYNF